MFGHHPLYGHNPWRGHDSMMIARLESFPPLAALLDEGITPEVLTERLLQDLPYTELEKSTTRHECRCSQDRAEIVLSDVARSELESAVTEGRSLEVQCDFCNTVYRLEVDGARSLLARTLATTELNGSDSP